MSTNKLLAGIVDRVRETNPLVHCITNYVTVNDCANALLAVGASPVMADDRAEVAEITSIAQALLLNIGTLNKRTIVSMKRAAKTAKNNGIPIILDPVGAGASTLRTRTAQELVQLAHPTLIRGNASEIATLHAGTGKTRGVDAAEDDQGEQALARITATAKALATQSGAVVAVTGATDIITDGNDVILIKNGHPVLSRITGSGCMLSCLCAAYCAAAPEKILEATAAAVGTMGLCGERAAAETEEKGTASFRSALIDHLSHSTSDVFAQGVHSEKSV